MMDAGLKPAHHGIELDILNKLLTIPENRINGLERDFIVELSGFASIC
jgi:hypothetical protein